MLELVVVHGRAHGLVIPVLTLLISLADHHKGSVAQSFAVLCDKEGSTTRGTGRTRGEVCPGAEHWHKCCPGTWVIYFTCGESGTLWNTE